MKGFKPSEIIDNPSFLFGRNKKGQLLDKLTINIKRGTNCELQGERRFGKTSTLRSLIKKFEAEESPKYILIYLNFKEENWLKGNANFNRYLIAKTIETVSKKKIFTENIPINDVILKPSESFYKIYQQLQDVPDFQMLGLLKEFIIFTASYYELSYVYIIDEYEHLFKYNLENPQGFNVLRTLSEEPSEQNFKPLIFIISGALSSVKFGESIGSPELNNLGAGVLHVSPINKSDFDEMWKFTITDIDIPTNSIILDSNTMFELSGGVPFYAKVIAESVLNQNSTVDYNLLIPHFEFIFNSLEKAESICIKKILKNEHLDNYISVCRALSEKGIVKEISDNFTINGKLFKEYLSVKYSTIDDIPIDDKQIQLLKLMKEIKNIITDINETCSNKGRELIFDLANDVDSSYNDMEELCLDRESMQNFASAIYKNLFERTKKTKSLDKLPAKMRDRSQDKNDIINIVDSLRNLYHHGKFSPRTHQYSKGDLLYKLIKTRNNPQKEDYFLIQCEVLKGFKEYLSTLNKEVRSK